MKAAKQKTVQFHLDFKNSESSAEMSSEEDPDGLVFNMRDISEEIKSYQKLEMSSFQRINLVLSELGNSQLQKYLND